MSATPEILAEYDAIEEQVANGELCPEDGEPHLWIEGQELYGEDADGNRGVWVNFKRCHKCGEE